MHASLFMSDYKTFDTALINNVFIFLFSIIQLLLINEDFT